MRFTHKEGLTFTPKTFFLKSLFHNFLIPNNIEIPYHSDSIDL